MARSTENPFGDQNLENQPSIPLHGSDPQEKPLFTEANLLVPEDSKVSSYVKLAK